MAETSIRAAFGNSLGHFPLTKTMSSPHPFHRNAVVAHGRPKVRKERGLRVMCRNQCFGSTLRAGLAQQGTRRRPGPRPARQRCWCHGPILSSITRLFWGKPSAGCADTSVISTMKVDCPRTRSIVIVSHSGEHLVHTCYGRLARGYIGAHLGHYDYEGRPLPCSTLTSRPC